MSSVLRPLTVLAPPLSAAAARTAIAFGLVAAAALPAQAQTEALQRCPRIAEAAARLACYDALLPPVPKAAAPATTATTVSPAAAGTAATATATAVRPAAAVAAAASATAATASEAKAPAASAASTAANTASGAAVTAGTAAAGSAASASLAERFGLPERARSEPMSIESTVGNDFYGWDPNTRIRLSNGQVWQVIDGSSGTVSPDIRRVKVTRGALGSFFLEFEGMNKAPRVRRVE